MRTAEAAVKTHLCTLPCTRSSRRPRNADQPVTSNYSGRLRGTCCEAVLPTEQQRVRRRSDQRCSMRSAAESAGRTLQWDHSKPACSSS